MKIPESCSECIGRGICETGDHRKYGDSECMNFHKLLEQKLTSDNSDYAKCIKDITKE